MTLKVTTLFNAVTVDSAGNGKRAGGFSESWYSNKTIDTAAFNAAWLNLLRTRAALMPANVTIIGQRVQTVDPLGPARTFENVYKGSGTLQNDLPQVALQWQMNSAAGTNHRNVTLRGVPDARVVKGEYNPTAEYNAALIAHFRELRANWLMRAKDRTQPRVRMRAATSDNPNGWQITTQTPHGLAVNDTVQILSGLASNGKKYSFTGRVVVVDDAAKFHVYPDTELVFGGLTGGRVQKRIVTYTEVFLNDAEMTDPLAVIRKCGRPFHQFRGRQTVRR